MKLSCSGPKSAQLNNISILRLCCTRQEMREKNVTCQSGSCLFGSNQSGQEPSSSHQPLCLHQFCPDDCCLWEKKTLWRLSLFLQQTQPEARQEGSANTNVAHANAPMDNACYSCMPYIHIYTHTHRCTRICTSILMRILIQIINLKPGEMTRDERKTQTEDTELNQIRIKKPKIK